MVSVLFSFFYFFVLMIVVCLTYETKEDERQYIILYLRLFGKLQRKFNNLAVCGPVAKLEGEG